MKVKVLKIKSCFSCPYHMRDDYGPGSWGYFCSHDNSCLVNDLAYKEDDPFPKHCPINYDGYTNEEMINLMEGILTEPDEIAEWGESYHKIVRKHLEWYKGGCKEYEDNIELSEETKKEMDKLVEKYRSIKQKKFS